MAPNEKKSAKKCRGKSTMYGLLIFAMKNVKDEQIYVINLSNTNYRHKPYFQLN